MRPQTQSTWKNFISGLAGYLRVPAALGKYKLWRYQLLPAFISLVVTSAMLIGLVWFADVARRWIGDDWNLDESGLVSLSIGVGIFLILALGFVFLHKRIVLILLAPFLGRIAEIITIAECGPQERVAMTQWQALRRGAHINLRALFLELLLTVVLAVAGLVLFISPITSGVILFISSRYAGYGLMDFPLEYRGLSVRESVAWTRRHKAAATGLGLGYQLILMVPLLGWMFAPTFATIAGTLRCIEEMRKNPPPGAT